MSVINLGAKATLAEVFLGNGLHRLGIQFNRTVRAKLPRYYQSMVAARIRTIVAQNLRETRRTSHESTCGYDDESAFFGQSEGACPQRFESFLDPLPEPFRFQESIPLVERTIRSHYWRRTCCTIVKI
jgi:hypothetical protein